MNAGFVQQVAAPQEIYNNPINKFVAGFIGTPSMNFFNGFAEEENGKVVLKIGGKESQKKIYLQGERAEILRQKAVGKAVTIGIRPEDIYEYEDALKLGIEKSTTGIKETICIREMLGADVLLYFEGQDKTYAVRLKPENETKPGETMEFYFDPEKVHVFDYETEENLLYMEEYKNEK